jgi:hypothetical protein
MASTPEGKVKDKVKRLLKKYGCYQFWPVQTGYGAPTLDCLACCKGHFIGIETKAPGKRPTPRQRLTMEDMREADATVIVVGEFKKGQEIGGKGTGIFCEEEYSGLGELEAWLLMLKD